MRRRGGALRLPTIGGNRGRQLDVISAARLVSFDAHREPLMPTETSSVSLEGKVTNMKTKGLRLGVLLVLIGAAVGCDVCADLDERMCNDLGAEDCALWKENKMTFSDTTKAGGGRRSGLKSLLFGDGSGTCSSSKNDAVYPQILSSTKQALEATRKANKAREAAGIK